MGDAGGEMDCGRRERVVGRDGDAEVPEAACK